MYIKHLVIDTNIFFNALLRIEGNTAKLFFYQEKNSLSFIAPIFLIQEVGKYMQKLATKKGIPLHEIESVANRLFDKITFIQSSIYEKSYALVQEEMNSIDPKDTDFVALAHNFECPLWTNDKKLKEHVTSIRVMNTDDIFTYLSNLA